jgi:hypothetical protein
VATVAPAAASGYGGPRRRISLALLVAANLLPLAGVLFLHWDIAALVVLYWSENLVLGFYTLLKMFTVNPLGAIPTGLFFAIHYGGFCAVHGLFILTLLIDDDAQVLGGDSWPLFLVFLQLLVEVVRQVLAHAPPHWLWAFAALMVSHGGSYMINFLAAGERERVTVRELMGAPYGRIAVLHVAIIAGGFAVMALGQPLALLIALVILKLGLDITLHLREHRRAAP